MEQQLETPAGGRIDDGPEDDLIVRAFAASISAGDGRTVDVRIVPYGEVAMADDGHGGVPRGVLYREQWMPGAFAHQERAANRVLLNFEHQPGIAGVIGHGVELKEADDGFYGSFRIHDTPDGDKALMLVREEVLGGVSLEAQSARSVRGGDGIVKRVKGHLRNVALCREGAYPSARVLVVRESPVFDEELLPVDPDPELLERCRALGIRMPQRYEAHPAETDTPDDESGTSEDGTRQETETPTSEE